MLLFFGFCLCFLTEFHLGIHNNLSSLVLFFISAVRLQNMRLYIITEFQIQYIQDFFLNTFIFYRKYNFHTAVKISWHPVSASHIDFINSIIFEIENTAVFQKFSNDRTYVDIFTDTWYTGSQAANTPNKQIDLYSTGRCIIECRNDCRITQRIHLRRDLRWFTLFCMFCFPIDQLQETVFHPDWCNDQTIPFLRLRISGKHIKYSRCIFSKTFITGKNTTVCI